MEVTRPGTQGSTRLGAAAHRACPSPLTARLQGPDGSSTGRGCHQSRTCQLLGSRRAFLASDLAAQTPFPTAGDGHRCPLKGRGPSRGGRGAGAPGTCWAASGHRKGLPVPLRSRESSLPPGRGHSSAPPAGEAWTGVLQQAPPRPPQEPRGQPPRHAEPVASTSGRLAADRPFPVSESPNSETLRTFGRLQPPAPAAHGRGAPHKPSETALKRRPGPNEARDRPARPRGPLTHCTRRGLEGQTLRPPRPLPSRQTARGLQPWGRPSPDQERSQGTVPLPSRGFCSNGR